LLQQFTCFIKTKYPTDINNQIHIYIEKTRLHVIMLHVSTVRPWSATSS